MAGHLRGTPRTPDDGKSGTNPTTKRVDTAAGRLGGSVRAVKTTAVNHLATAALLQGMYHKVEKLQRQVVDVDNRVCLALNQQGRTNSIGAVYDAFDEAMAAIERLQEGSTAQGSARGSATSAATGAPALCDPCFLP